MERQRASPDYSVIMARDPKVGMAIPGLKDVSERTLVVHVGTCQSCTAIQFRPNDLARSTYPVRVYYQGDSPRWMEEAQAVGFSVLKDQNGGVAGALNLPWSPRWFVLDRGGKMLRLQSHPQEVHP